MHVGSHIFQGSLGAIGSLGVSPTADSSSNQKTYGSKKPLTKKKKRGRVSK
jgi:hypothetical protein